MLRSFKIHGFMGNHKLYKEIHFGWKEKWRTHADDFITSRTRAAGWVGKTRILLNSWKMQAYAGLPQSRLFPINVIAIFLNKWTYQKTGVQWKPTVIHML